MTYVRAFSTLGAPDLTLEETLAFATAHRIPGVELRALAGTRILWDSHHTWRKGGEDPVKTWAAMQPHICHVHVKDSIDRPGARAPYTYVLPGEGAFPMQPLVERLRTDGYAGPLSLEWEKLWHPDLPSLDQALRVARQHDWW